jgi:tetratricopeptide (TPR) repeat protein
VTSFIADLKRRLPEADWPTVVASLRNQPEIWIEFQEPALAEQALEFAGTNREQWSPGFLGLLHLGYADHFESLRTSPMQPVAEKLRYQAAAAFEQTAGEVDKQCPTVDLAQSTLLALALRERRRVLNSWDQLADDLGVQGSSDVTKSRSQFWKLPISVLFGLLPNPHELLAYLISPDKSAELQQLGIHALISNPLPLDVQSAHLMELVRGFPLPEFLTMLRSVAKFNTALAQQAAMQALENLQDRESGEDELSEIQRLLLEAEVNQISGQISKADGLLRSAWEASRQLESELASKLAESNGLDPETVAELKKSADPKKMRAKSKRPAALVSAAKVALNSENLVEAKEMALAALQASRNETGTDKDAAATLSELANLFIEMQMPAEALAAAEAAANSQPNDANRAHQYGKLLLENGRSAEALQQAHLAAALSPKDNEIRRNLARSLQKNDQPEEAFQEWKAMLDNEAEPSVEDWLSYAETALQSDHLDETLKACQYALSLQPTNGAAYELIGSALLAQGDDGSALAHLGRATELAPTQNEGWKKLAELQLAQKDANDSLATLTSAQQFVTFNAEMQALLADTYLALDRKQDALAAYLQAAKIANEQGDAQTSQEVTLKVSSLQLASGAQNAAMQTLEAAQQSFPNNSAIAARLGKLLLQVGEPKRALSSLKQALQADADNSELLLNLAQAQLAIGESAAQAEQTLEVLLAQSDAPLEGQVLLAQAKAAQGKHSEAIKAFEAAQKTLGKDSAWNKRLLLGKAHSQAASGKPVAALTTLESLDRETPDDLEVQRELCVCYKEAGRGQEAAQIAQKVLLGNPQDEDTLVWYAELMNALGYGAVASKALAKSANASNARPRLLLSFAKLQWSGDSPEAAQKTLAQINRFADADASALAGLFLLNQGAAKESIAYFKRALDIAAPQVVWLENLAKAHMQTEQWSNVLEALEQALQLTPNQPRILSQKAEVLLKLGRPQSALETIETSLQTTPSDLSLQNLKTQILREQQDWTAALNAASKAFELDTSHPGNLLNAAELAVICLQSDLAREFISNSKATAKPSLELTCLNAELALDASLEIEAAKILGNAVDENHPRVLALQSQLASCRGDHSQAKQLLQRAVELHQRQATPDMFTAIGIAKAAERLNDWQTAIVRYEIVAKQFPSQIMAQFNLGKALLLRAEWQQLCDASQAKTAQDSKALGKDAKLATKQAFAAAYDIAADSWTQAMIAGWQLRSELRFGAKLDLSALPHGFPATPVEAAAVIAAGRRLGELELAEQIAKAFNDAPELLVEKAIAYLESNVPEALVFIQQAAVVLLHSAPVQALAAHIARKAGELVNALPFVQRALALWPDQVNWQTLAGEIQLALGNLMEAKGHFTIATQLEPEEGKHYFALGNTLVAAHSLDEGVRNLQHASQLEPKRAEYSIALARAFRKSGDNMQAKSYAEQAQKQSPQDVSALLLQAELSIEDGNAQEAKQLAEKALKVGPKNVASLRLFAEALHALGETEDAIDVLDRARENAEDELPLLVRRAQLLSSDRGLDALIKLSQRYPERPEIFLALSEALAEAGSIAEAIQAAQRAAKKAGKEAMPEQLASMHLHLGKLLKQSGNLDQSLHHLDQAAKLAPFSAASQIERGRVFLARRQSDQALKAFQQAASLAPNDATPHFEVGLALKEARDYNAAEAELRKAAKLAPKDRHIQRQLAAVIALNIVHHTEKEPLRASDSERGNPQQKLQESSL